jgi:hypothetical protein
MDNITVSRDTNPDYVKFIESNSAQWVKVQGVSVLRVHSQKYVGSPCSGRKNSARFDIVDIEKGEIVTQLTKKEVFGWLFKRWEECNESLKPQVCI